MEDSKQLLKFISKIDDILNRKEEEFQSQSVANPNGHYMKEECSYYHEQAITTLRSEEVAENQMEKRNEEKIKAPQDLHREEGKEVSTEASSISIPETPRGKESSLLMLLKEQIVAIKAEKLHEYFPHIILVHDSLRMRNYLRRFRVIYPDMETIRITYLKAKFILFGLRE